MKTDPMYYKNRIDKLINEAKKNGLKVYGENTKDGVKMYIEAHEYDCWSLKISNRY